LKARRRCDLVEIAEIRDYEVDLAHDIAPTRSFGFASAVREELGDARAERAVDDADDRTRTTAAA
jgi:hypothetical protein